MKHNSNTVNKAAKSNRGVAKDKGLHPRNPHRQAYDFEALAKVNPSLQQHLSAQDGVLRLDFANPDAVKCLNQAILASEYQVNFWDIPQGYLCPPIPGRADALHYLADLLALTGQVSGDAEENSELYSFKKSFAKGSAKRTTNINVIAQANADKVPSGKKIRVLDVGTGANCVYPILGSRAYGWQFIGSDIDPVAVKVAKAVCDSNPVLKGNIKTRLQEDKNQIFVDIIREDEGFDLTMCNPPFHASLAQANAGSERKVKNLARSGANKTLKIAKNSKGDAAAKPALNFGGTGSELWCKGGELAFILRMIAESQRFGGQVLWFSTLVSKKENLPDIYRALKIANAQCVATLDMPQGNKQTRIVAWSYHTQHAQQTWRDERWT